MGAVSSEPWDDDDAASYDSDVADQYEPEVLGPAVDFLVELADRRRVLEFAVGTGRVALALVERGVDVSGIELSEPMVAVMRAKPFADRVRVVVGDMSTTRVDGEFGVVYLVFNTITNLLTQDAQVACFENAAAHLEPGGHFVIETFVPALRRLPPGERFVAFDVSERHVGIDEYDVASQMLVSHHLTTGDGGARRSSPRFRYAWPAEYDLMARLAGLRLQERWADWRRATFDGDSTAHVSVWIKP